MGNAGVVRHRALGGEIVVVAGLLHGGRSVEIERPQSCPACQLPTTPPPVANIGLDVIIGVVHSALHRQFGVIFDGRALDFCAIKSGWCRHKAVGGGGGVVIIGVVPHARLVIGVDEHAAVWEAGSSLLVVHGWKLV